MCDEYRSFWIFFVIGGDCVVFRMVVLDWSIDRMCIWCDCYTICVDDVFGYCSVVWIVDWLWVYRLIRYWVLWIFGLFVDKVFQLCLVCWVVGFMEDCRLGSCNCDWWRIYSVYVVGSECYCWFWFDECSVVQVLVFVYCDRLWLVACRMLVGFDCGFRFVLFFIWVVWGKIMFL